MSGADSRRLLTLLRHAKSSWKDVTLGDFERPLNRRGERDAPEMGRRLAALGFAPDLIVASPAERALRTARTLAREIGYPVARIRFEESLYGATPETLLAEIRALDDALGHVAIVGHNPGLTELHNALAAPGIDNIPTCGVVRLELGVGSWKRVTRRCATLLDFDYPKRPAR